MTPRTAIYPGSFDPVTLGHMDIIHRACKLFDKVIVAVLTNPDKHTAFTVEERMDQLRRCTRDLPQVEVGSFNGLVADYAAENRAVAVVRGLRAMSDFEYEFQMALTNKTLNAKLETVFLATRAEYLFISSSAVKQIAMFGGNIERWVPACIEQDVRARIYAGGQS